MFHNIYLFKFWNKEIVIKADHMLKKSVKTTVIKLFFVLKRSLIFDKIRCKHKMCGIKSTFDPKMKLDLEIYSSKTHLKFSYFTAAKTNFESVNSECTIWLDFLICSSNSHQLTTNLFLHTEILIAPFTLKWF